MMKTFARLFIGALTITAAGTIGPTALCSFADDASDPHAHHHHMMMQETMRTMADYEVPRLSLVREDGKRVFLSDELNDGRAVALNFIFTTCTAICPVTSKVFSQLQTKLGNDQAKVHLVSISIDPEHDTPTVLREYAHKFGAGEGWQFYTGTVEASVAAQQAFGVYRGDKMSHTPVTLLRTVPEKPWIRIDGFATADELLDEFRELVTAK
jgi:protein SCO1/2